MTPEQPAAQPTIEAKPTNYNGTLFRSVLEATWAANLDHLGIRWDYEPEMFTLPSGTRYLPDFRLPELGIWLEVKGTGVPRVEKAVELGRHLACNCADTCTCDRPGGHLVLIGHPPEKHGITLDDLIGPAVNYARLRNIERREPSSLSWSTAYGRTAWFIRECPRCGRAGWMQGSCRACGSRCAGTHAYNSGDPDLKFHRGLLFGGGLGLDI